ncbi:hypothetical protein FDECE_10806 [Fusarium decemcellulare]|nr:hypothetical protein FDECE_10806 [Fusarium decemcellulare]
MASVSNTIASPANNATGQEEGMKIIHAGLFRMATASMAEAYRILGYKAHHGLEDVFHNPWVEIEHAAEATWPHLAKLPGYTYKPQSGEPRPPFKQADWERIWGGYDVATDLASPFVLELIKAYPDAKVVVVQRKFETWWPSYRSELLDSLYHNFSSIQQFIGWNILGIRAAHAMKKVHAGFFSADKYSKEAILPRARDTYEEYYRKIREAVPLESGRRLEYNMGDGWEPLCEFLGKDVPDVPFPRVNDRQAHSDGVRARNIEALKNAILKVGPVAALMVSIAVYAWKW